MTRYALSFFLLVTTPAGAKDYMIVVTDQERAALQDILDVAAKAAGTKQAGITVNALYFADKFAKALEVVERKEDDTNKQDVPK